MYLPTSATTTPQTLSPPARESSGARSVPQPGLSQARPEAAGRRAVVQGLCVASPGQPFPSGLSAAGSRPPCPPQALVVPWCNRSPLEPSLCDAERINCASDRFRWSCNHTLFCFTSLNWFMGSIIKSLVSFLLTIISEHLSMGPTKQQHPQARALSVSRQEVNPTEPTPPGDAGAAGVGGLDGVPGGPGWWREEDLQGLQSAEGAHPWEWSHPVCPGASWPYKSEVGLLPSQLDPTLRNQVWGSEQRILGFFESETGRWELLKSNSKLYSKLLYVPSLLPRPLQTEKSETTLCPHPWFSCYVPVPTSLLKN